MDVELSVPSCSHFVSSQKRIPQSRRGEEGRNRIDPVASAICLSGAGCNDALKSSSAEDGEGEEEMRGIRRWLFQGRARDQNRPFRLLSFPPTSFHFLSALLPFPPLATGDADSRAGELVLGPLATVDEFTPLFHFQGPVITELDRTSPFPLAGIGPPPFSSSPLVSGCGAIMGQKMRECGERKKKTRQSPRWPMSRVEMQ